MTSEQDAQNTENFDEMGDEIGYGGEDFSPYSQSDTRGIEEDDRDEQEELFERLGNSSDDPEQKRRYIEYLSLIKEIEWQNQTVEEIKGKIMDLCGKACKTRCEIREIKRLRDCMEQENLKLRVLMTKAIQLQNFGSHRLYREIQIATTIDEENLSPYVGCIPAQASSWKGGDRAGGSDKSAICDRGGASDQSEEPDSCATSAADSTKEDKNIMCLCNALNKMRPSCPEDRKIIKEITEALCCKQKSKQRSPCLRKSRSSGRQGEQKTCVDSIEKLKQKIICMQSSVNKLKQEILCRERRKQEDCARHRQDRDDTERRRQDRGDCREPRANRHYQPQPQDQYQSFNRSQSECQEPQDQVLLSCMGKRSTKSDELEKLKRNYCDLMSEFARKDAQLRDLEQRMKGMCGSCGAGGAGGGGEDSRLTDEAELNLLRTRVNEMKEEQVEFKCIMKEQSQQLEDYRNKYLLAQQKVEEQSVTLEKLNMNNRRIEKQINTEVKEIRAKFQEKLNELLHFPKMLENEQLKLAAACKEKDELQSKLVLVCKEMKSLKAQVEQPKDGTDCRPQLAKCQLELSQLKSKYEQCENQRELYCEELKKTQEDLDTLRSESAKIIARTKERAEVSRQQQQEQIDRLEKELAQCRATACLSVNDREAVIREMQGQLNTLSYSFDAAQKQIKTLRNHIAYVSNDNCFPVKC